MTPFFVFLMIPQQNSGKNFAFSEIHGENVVAFVNSSQIPELATVAGGKNR